MWIFPGPKSSIRQEPSVCRKCQIYGEDFVNIRGLLRKYKLYLEQIFPPIFWIFTGIKGDGIESRLSFLNIFYFKYIYIRTLFWIQLFYPLRFSEYVHGLAFAVNLLWNWCVTDCCDQSKTTFVVIFFQRYHPYIT